MFVTLQALLEKWLGLRVVVTGDQFRSGEQSLIIMNHRTCLDWLYFWAVLARQSGVDTQKIILKSPLKHIPGAGTWFLTKEVWWSNLNQIPFCLVHFAYSVLPNLALPNSVLLCPLFA